MESLLNLYHRGENFVSLRSDTIWSRWNRVYFSYTGKRPITSSMYSNDLLNSLLQISFLSSSCSLNLMYLFSIHPSVAWGLPWNPLGFRRIQSYTRQAAFHPITFSNTYLSCTPFRSSRAWGLAKQVMTIYLSWRQITVYYTDGISVFKPILENMK